MPELQMEYHVSSGIEELAREFCHDQSCGQVSIEFVQGFRGLSDVIEIKIVQDGPKKMIPEQFHNLRKLISENILKWGHRGRIVMTR